MRNYQLYKQNDIKIMHQNSETFGMTMLEAMKCGLPILATNNQISKEILSSAGFCKDTSNDIKDNLIKMIENKNILKSKIINGKKISNKFKWNITSKRTFKFLENLGK